MSKRFLMTLLTLMLACLLACVALASCQDSEDAPEVTTAPTANTEPVTTLKEVSDMTEPETENVTTEPEEEVFKPDPDRAVPRYDEVMSNMDSFPIAFNYGGVAYKGFEGFELESETYEDIDRGVKSTLVYRHPDIPAAFELIATVYPQESAYEYVVYITNDGDENTENFSDLALALEFVGENPSISGIKGDSGGQNYRSYKQKVSERYPFHEECTSGRPSHGVFPYYNLKYGESDGDSDKESGSFIAIGWPGNWSADFTHKKDTATTTVRAAQSKVDTYLLPGETLRTPLVGIVDYENLNDDEQANAWRHYYINDVMRKIDGELTPTYVGVGNLSQGMTTEKELLMLEAYRRNGIDLDVIWMDAGWYTGANGETVGWGSTGTLDIDYSRFPDGMSSIGEYAKEIDAMYLLWFEPEVMRLDTEAFLAGQPDFEREWLMGNAGGFMGGQIIDLGIPECREWIFNKICKVIDTSGATGYRQDFNSDPAPAWAAKDAKYEGRTGMSENQYVQGYLALWDALIEKYGMFIDSCASGGGRNDLETMKRGVPLHYSDHFDGSHEDYNTKGKMTQALFQWFPYFKNESYEINLYKLRMNYAPFCLLKVPSALDKDTDWALMRQAYAEYDVIRDYFYGDYYLLTEKRDRPDRWDARMFYVPESGEGFAFVACQEWADELTNTICLKGLEPDRQYHITDFDGLVDVTASGKQLMEEGVTVTVPEQPYAAILLINPAE